MSSVRHEDTLKGNAFKDSVSVVQFLIPAGIVEISRGSRSNSDDHPRVPIPKDPHPERCAGSVGSNTTATLPRPAAGVEFLLPYYPRVFGREYRPRPGANFHDPSGIKSRPAIGQSLKALP